MEWFSRQCVLMCAHSFRRDVSIDVRVGVVPTAALGGLCPALPQKPFGATLMNSAASKLLGAMARGVCCMRCGVLRVVRHVASLLSSAAERAENNIDWCSLCDGAHEVVMFFRLIKLSCAICAM